MANLVATDIKDELIKNIVTNDETYLDRADDALVDLASRMGIEEDDIETTTLPYHVKEYLKAYVGWEVCFNNLGLNKQKIGQDGLELDPYDIKLPFYEKRLDKFKSGMTAEILTGDADTPEEYASQSANIYRS